MKGAAAAALLLLGCASRSREPEPLPSHLKEAFDLLARQTLQGGKHQGLVIAVLRNGRRDVFGYGRRSAADPRPPDGRTVFEIGSITKTFTGILLAQAANEGTVALDDPVRKHLPDSVRMPSRGGLEITFHHLATHTSSLPAMPSNIVAKNPLNPYADYTVENLYAGLSACALGRDPGERYEYSNLGAGLLGHVLALKAQTSYEDLVVARIASRLGMNDTRIGFTEGMKSRLAPGHWPNGKEIPNWDIPTLAGAGALRSTADDLLTYLAANLEPDDGVLGKAMKRSHEPRASIDDKENQIGLGWHRSRLPLSRRTMVWHDGATGGYHSFAGFVPSSRTAAVVLANSSEEIGMLPLLVLDVLNR